MFVRRLARRNSRFFFSTAILAAALVAAGSANASLIFGGAIHLSGTGLGAVNTLTTAEDPGGPGDRNGTESSCVEFNGSTTVETCHFLTGEQGGDNLAINQTFSLSALGATNAGMLALVVDLNETGNDKTADLTGLYLNLYNGSTSRNFYYMGPTLTLSQDNEAPNGTGQSGFLFTLDQTQAGMATAFCGTFDCIVGGGFQFAAGSTSAGHESLFISTTAGVSSSGGGGAASGGALPEPGSLALLGASLIAGFASWRRRR
jgi:PEP-CTERM motif